MMRLEKSLENVSQQGRGKPEWMMSPRMNLQKQIHIWDSQNTPCPRGLFERQCSWDNISRLISTGIKYIGHHELRRPHTCQFRSPIFFFKRIVSVSKLWTYYFILQSLECLPRGLDKWALPETSEHTSSHHLTPAMLTVTDSSHHGVCNDLNWKKKKVGEEEIKRIPSTRHQVMFAGKECNERKAMELVISLKGCWGRLPASYERRGAQPVQGTETYRNS